MHPQISDSVAQLVEQYTFNVWALGSNPSGITKKVHFGTKRTFLFHPNKACFNEEGNKKGRALRKQGGLQAWNESKTRKTSNARNPKLNLKQKETNSESCASKVDFMLGLSPKRGKRACS